LALATEPPHEKLLERKPYPKTESIISPKMWKHILIQALFELVILLFLYLYAPYFIIENEPGRINESQIVKNCFFELPGKEPYQDENGILKYYIIHGSSTMWKSDVYLKPGMTSKQCGNYAEKTDLLLAYKTYNSNMGGTTQMTMIFNTFVFYTLFNQFNARVIDDDFNIFYNIHKNFLFFLIMGVEMALQVLIVEFGSNAFKVVNRGLTGSQWGICFAFAAVTFPVSILCKLLQIDDCIKNMIEKCCSCKSNKVDDEKKQENSNNEVELHDYNNNNNRLAIAEKSKEQYVIQPINNEQDPAALKNQGRGGSGINRIRSSQKHQPQEQNLRGSKHQY
jgi:Ca2+ transporting ATPase